MHRNPWMARSPRARAWNLATCIALALGASTAGAVTPDGVRELVASGRIPLSPPLRALVLADRSGPRPGATLAVSNCDDSGPGSLRDTINAASSDDTIDLTLLSCSRITLTSGAIFMGQENLAIQGPGSARLAIDGNLHDGIFRHLGSGTLEVGGLRLENAFKYRTDGTAVGGCIDTIGSVVAVDTQMRNCNAVSTSNHAALGGAIYAGGQVVLDHSIVTGSMAKASGNGYASGGGIYARNGIVAKYSTISNNVAISESTTPSFGGGMLAWNGGLILGSTISGNIATRSAGLHLVGTSSYTNTIINSTVSGNHGTRIGGIFARSKLNLYNSTIAFNTSHEWESSTGTFWAAGVYITVAGEMDSTIIANNVNDGAPVAFPTTDLTGAPSTGFNGGHNNVMFCGSGCPTDTTHEDPGLGPLGDHGGITNTHVPTPGIWDTFGGTNVLGWSNDQRGPSFPRQSPPDFPEIGALQINSDVIFANGFN